MATTNEFTIGSVRVPPLAVGSMYFGTTAPSASAMACLNEAFEIGALFWDTANNYAFWAGGVGDESESTIGQWLATQGSAARSHVTIATKLDARPSTPGADLESALGLSRGAIRPQLMDSLRRLGTDYVDVLYAHIDDRVVPFDQTFGALGELVNHGLVREVAASNLTADRLR